jgi:hypothetical protein
VFLKLSDRLANVTGDGRFFRDDQGLAHIAALLYAVRRCLRNIFFTGTENGGRGGWWNYADFTREFDTNCPN